MIPWLGASYRFPPVEQALSEPNGLLAAGGDLSPERLLWAYRQGIFPWFSEGQPILWWSPDPRMVLFPHELVIGRTLGKSLRKGTFEVRCDHSFAAVMHACAAPRRDQDGTWISQAMIDAYVKLHARGIAHSVETWQEGRLVGGLYGIAIGRAFFGESMFSRASDASKVAFVHLVRFLQNNDFGIIDCQMRTDLLSSFGAREIPRRRFVEVLAELVNYPALLDRWPQILSLSDDKTGVDSSS